MFLLIFYISNTLIFAQSNEQISINKYFSEETSKFSSKNSEKAKGLNLQFKYPNTWRSLDGERPHVVRKFAQPGGTVLAMILIYKLGKKPTKLELNNFFTLQVLKSNIPATASYISSNPEFMIEGLRAGSIEFTNIGKRVNQTFLSHNISYLFYYEEYSVIIQFMVFNAPGESSVSVSKRFSKLKNLFSAMFNSIVITNKWQ
jgi:hypothetical protein